jgi:hypothetical protein
MMQPPLSRQDKTNGIELFVPYSIVVSPVLGGLQHCITDTAAFKFSTGTGGRWHRP